MKKQKNTKQQLFEMMNKVAGLPFRKLVINLDQDEAYLITDENKYNELLKYGKTNKTENTPYNIFNYLWYEWLEIPNEIAKKI